MWSKYLSLATLAYNTFNTPNLLNFSPYELCKGAEWVVGCYCCKGAECCATFYML